MQHLMSRRSSAFVTFMLESGLPVTLAALLVGLDLWHPMELGGVYYLLPAMGAWNRKAHVVLAGGVSGLAALWISEYFLPQWGIGAQADEPAELVIHSAVMATVMVVSLSLVRTLLRQSDEAAAQRGRHQTELAQQMANQWAVAVDARHPYTAGHSERVAYYAMALAVHVPGFRKAIDLDAFRLAGTLHDVGKISTPDYILNKPSKLTPEEFQLIQAHSVQGYELVLRTGASAQVAAIVRHHHERFDGKGYPDGLKGEEIPLPVRVLSVADAFDAMTSLRPYRTPLSPEEAYREILTLAGSQFDPLVVRALGAVFPIWLHAYQRFTSQSGR